MEKNFMNDGSVKKPSIALHGILSHGGVPVSAPYSFGFVRLAAGAFYFAIQIQQVTSTS